MIPNSLVQSNAAISAPRSVDRSPPKRIWLFLTCLLLGATGCRTPAPVRGLRPIYPPVRYGIADPQRGPEVIFVEIDSNQPTLKWAPFPGKGDRKADKHGLLNRIERVRYELRIWLVGSDGAPADLIYERRDLPQPEHKLEALLLGGRYCWTVRACFEINGQQRVTPWAFCLWPWTMGDALVYGVQHPQRIDQVSPANYYRFERP